MFLCFMRVAVIRNLAGDNVVTGEKAKYVARLLRKKKAE